MVVRDQAVIGTDHLEVELNHTGFRGGSTPERIES